MPDKNDLKTGRGKKMVEDQIVSSMKQKYGGNEIPKKFVFIADDVTVDNGMLTRTLKLKRRVVMDKYRPDIESL